MSKTPVSILQELMQRRGVVPQYDLLPSEGIGTHLPTFYYRVSALNVSRMGKARSKKDAKHEAARLALEAFSEMGIYHPEHGIPAPSSPVACGNSILPNQINAVGILKEFCAEHNIPEPIFDLISDIGPAHQRHFTIECKIGTMTGISATDLTKKKAKQAAAQKMLNRLQESLPDVMEEYQNVNTSVPSITQEIIDVYNENTPKRKINWGLKISSYPQSIKKIMKEEDLTYNDIWQDIVEEDSGCLQNILNKLKLSYAIDFMENDDDTTIIFLSINSDPEFVLSNFGKTKEEAFNSVLKPTFDFLKIMTQ